MRKEKNHGRKNTTGGKPSCKTRSSPIEEGTKPLMERGQHADQQQGGKELKSSNHGRQYAANQDSGIAVSIGRQVAALSRYQPLPADRTRTEMQMTSLLASLLMRTPTTAADALVMATIARNLSAAVVATLPEMAEDDVDMPLRVSFALLSHAVAALETVTGLSSASFTGTGPALN